MPFLELAPVGQKSRLTLALTRALAIFVIVAVAAGCGTSDELPSDLADTLSSGSSVVLLGDTSSEQIDTGALELIAERSASLGTNLRIVVSGGDRELIDARAIADRFGGTALAYRTGDVAFKAASADLSNEQLTRATNAAATEIGVPQSASAFVDVVEREGVEAGDPGWLRPVLYAALALAAIFLLWQLRAFIVGRGRSRRRRDELDRRRNSLSEWVGLLEGEATELQLSQHRLGLDDRRVLDETRGQIAAARSAVGSDPTLADLDANEIRVARAASKLRALRAGLHSVGV